MIKIPNLKKEHLKEVLEIKGMEGWRIIVQSLEYSIKTMNVELANWKFEYDDEARIKPISLKKFEELQKEALLLKEFLSFLDNCDKMTSDGVKSLDPYEK